MLRIYEKVSSTVTVQYLVNQSCYITYISYVFNCHRYTFIFICHISLDTWKCAGGFTRPEQAAAGIAPLDCGAEASAETERRPVCRDQKRDSYASDGRGASCRCRTSRSPPTQKHASIAAYVALARATPDAAQAVAMLSRAERWTHVTVSARRQRASKWKSSTYSIVDMSAILAEILDLDFSETPEFSMRLSREIFNH